jgi:hypothetical protein
MQPQGSCNTYFRESSCRSRRRRSGRAQSDDQQQRAPRAYTAATISNMLGIKGRTNSNVVLGDVPDHNVPPASTETHATRVRRANQNWILGRAIGLEGRRSRGLGRLRKMRPCRWCQSARMEGGALQALDRHWFIRSMYSLRPTPSRSSPGISITGENSYKATDHRQQRSWAGSRSSCRS